MVTFTCSEGRDSTLTFISFALLSAFCKYCNFLGSPAPKSLSVPGRHKFTSKPSGAKSSSFFTLKEVHLPVVLSILALKFLFVSKI